MTAAITDFNQYAGLRVGAENRDPAVLREVAGQFEALFVQTIFKNMRAASLGDPLFGDSDQHEMYQDMLDQQLALEMSSGKGVGLADMLVRQLGGEPAGASVVRRNAPLRSVTPSRQAAAWSDPAAFAGDVWPHAQRAGKRLNVAPEAILAQAALETGWGAHVPESADGRSSLNVFGIKAGRGWDGDSVARQTLEFDNGVARPETAKFRAYGHVADVFEDYSTLLSENPRYASVANHGDDVAGFASALQASGYATDPAYAEKIKRVFGSETMRMVLDGLKKPALPPTSLSGGRLTAGID